MNCIVYTGFTSKRGIISKHKVMQQNAKNEQKQVSPCKKGLEAFLSHGVIDIIYKIMRKVSLSIKNRLTV
jgi:hypothetical protein